MVSGDVGPGGSTAQGGTIFILILVALRSQPQHLQEYPAHQKENAGQPRT
jgi:hypothetical protein